MAVRFARATIAVSGFACLVSYGAVAAYASVYGGGTYNSSSVYSAVDPSPTSTATSSASPTSTATPSSTPSSTPTSSSGPSSSPSAGTGAGTVQPSGSPSGRPQSGGVLAPTGRSIGALTGLAAIILAFIMHKSTVRQKGRD